jgi:hypothetical protein
MVSVTIWLLVPWRNIFCHALSRELGVPPSNTGHFEEDRKALPLSGIEPQLLGPPVSFLVTIPIMMWQLTEERAAEEKKVSTTY